MEKTRIRVSIMGREYVLLSEKNEEHLVCIAEEVDAKMRELKLENPDLTYDRAAVLAALNLYDELFTLRSEKENMEKASAEEKEDSMIRRRLVEYSKELSRADGTIKRLEKELEAIKRESIEKEERLKREYAAKEKEMLDMLDSM